MGGTRERKAKKWLILALACAATLGGYYSFDFPSALHNPLRRHFGVPGDDFEFYFSLLYSLYSPRGTSETASCCWPAWRCCPSRSRRCSMRSTTSATATCCKSPHCNCKLITGVRVDYANSSCIVHVSMFRGQGLETSPML